MLVNQVYAFYACWMRPVGMRLVYALAANTGNRSLAAYGPMGRPELDLLRERLDKSEEIAQ